MPVSLPRFIKKAFATDGLKTAIPDSSNNVTGRAGYDQGFPPINMQPKEAGGIPPDGTDMNGVLYDATLAISYIQSGKFFPFNSDFATAIGGYPIGAIVSDVSNSTLWLNGVNNNSAFPAGWTNFSFSDPTETVRGVPLVATQAETNNGIDDAKIVTPKKLRAGFSFLFGTNGFAALPTWMGGFIIQWGQVGGFDSYTISFPMTFPNGPFTQPIAVCVGTGSADISTASFVETSYLSTSQFRAFTYRPGEAGGVVRAPRGVAWFCVGR